MKVGNLNFISRFSTGTGSVKFPRVLLQFRLRWSERAVDRPFTAESSSLVDAALVRLEGR